MPRNRRKFSPEFKDEAVKAVIMNSRPIAQVAREIAVNEGTLGNWVAAYRRDHADEEPALDVSERARLREAERLVRGSYSGLSRLDRIEPGRGGGGRVGLIGIPGR